MNEGIPVVQYAWLIEARWQPPHYLGIWKLGRTEFFWTDDHNRALRFARKKDAEALLGLLYEMSYPFHTLVRYPGPAPVVVEHAWDGALPKEPTDG